jgi:hypothetical protein
MKYLAILLSHILFGCLGIQVLLILVFLWYLRSSRKTLLPDNQLPKTAVILCLRVKFVISLIMLNQEECDLPNLLIRRSQTFSLISLSQNLLKASLRGVGGVFRTSQTA